MKFIDVLRKKQTKPMDRPLINNKKNIIQEKKNIIYQKGNDFHDVYFH